MRGFGLWGGMGFFSITKKVVLILDKRNSCGYCNCRL